MAPRSVPGSAGPRPAAPRPDPTLLRFTVGTGGIAALSALLTAIVAPPSAPSPPSSVAVPTAQATVTQQRPIQYVQLVPGQAPPPGARVSTTPNSGLQRALSRSSPPGSLSWGTNSWRRNRLAGSGLDLSSSSTAPSRIRTKTAGSV